MRAIRQSEDFSMELWRGQILTMVGKLVGFDVYGAAVVSFICVLTKDV